MEHLLLLVSLPAENTALAAKLVKTASCFLETTGAVAATTVAVGHRLVGKGKSRERLTLLRFPVAGDLDALEGRARRLEGMLRELLVDARVAHADVRVSVEEHDPETS
ncbi:MAG: hypothetical protein ACHREM_33670 [Polyangiales bacterium]